MSEAAVGPGRPRSRDVDLAILDATIAVLCEGGFAAASIEAVAARAGVSRPTVYRRHADREALIEAAVVHLFERDAPPLEPTDDGMADVLNLLASTVRMLTRTPIGPVFRAAVPHLARYPWLGRLANALGHRRRTALRAALERCVREGLLREQSLDALIDGLLGAIYFRFLITGRRLDRRYVENLFEALS